MGGRHGCIDGGGRTEDAWDDHKEREEEIIMPYGGTEGWSRDMNALLTFRRRHVVWRRGSSAEEDDKYKAVKCK